MTPTEQQRVGALVQAVERLASRPPEPVQPLVTALESTLAVLDRAFDKLPDCERHALSMEYSEVRERAMDVLLMDPGKTVSRCKFCHRPITHGLFCGDRCRDEYQYMG